VLPSAGSCSPPSGSPPSELPLSPTTYRVTNQKINPKSLPGGIKSTLVHRYMVKVDIGIGLHMVRVDSRVDFKVRYRSTPV